MSDSGRIRLVRYSCSVTIHGPVPRSRVCGHGGVATPRAGLIRGDTRRILSYGTAVVAAASAVRARACRGTREDQCTHGHGTYKEAAGDWYVHRYTLHLVHSSALCRDVSSE